MDEPTNFLDVQGLNWLEEWFRQFPRRADCGVPRQAFPGPRRQPHRRNRELSHSMNIRATTPNTSGKSRCASKPSNGNSNTRKRCLIYEAEAIADRREALKNPARALKRRLANIKKQAQPRPMDKIITNIYQRLHVPD